MKDALEQEVEFHIAQVAALGNTVLVMAMVILILVAVIVVLILRGGQRH